MRRVKSRKKLTQEQALVKMESFFMQRQNIQEMITINLLPNLHKEWMELDYSLRFALEVDDYTSVQQAIDDMKKHIEVLDWKIYEDYGRFVNPGLHKVSGGFFFYKGEVAE